MGLTRELVKLVALAAINGVVVGLCIGGAMLLLLRVSVESPMVPKESAPVGTVLTVSRLSLPVPGLMIPGPGALPREFLANSLPVCE